MALLTNSQNTYAQVGIREDLEDMVYRIDPEETPFQSNINTSARVKQTKHEWQIQTLATAVSTNQNLEGDDSVNATAATARTRIINYCEIAKKTYAVSGTANAVTVAGVDSELAEQTLLKGIEIKRDIELSLLSNKAYNAGGTLTARVAAGLPAYITNTSSDSQAYTVGSGTGATAWVVTNMTTQALNLTVLTGAMQAAYQSGGSPKMLMVSPARKVDFSRLALGASAAGTVQLRYNIPTPGPGVLIGAVEAWQSDFGAVQVIVNRQMSADTTWANRTAYLIDPRYAAVGFLRPMFSEDLAKTGDNVKRHVLAEYTLIVGAPLAHALITRM